ncbi:hypothetical protein [Chondromyces apiculatus]|uniref:Uncharacterized protein n=1 Tax=Chondromyces apiculatus DSM 436 TaxID=1192034 RepID=A0A017T2N9_9BACT|nr:hypothetical protein [Chondromyces apiculatus]EYF03519.1 Hypothetical protein CAP_5503 [Chondromyces apiculatus DSM 436]
MTPVRKLLTATALVMALLAPCRASAQSLGMVPRTEREQQWYGWQNLIGLGVGYGTLALGEALDNELDVALVATGAGVLVLSGPAIHLAHENLPAAGASLGLNLGLPLGGGLLGMGVMCATNNCTGWFAELGAAVGALGGGIAGALAAHVVDAAALAYEETEVRSGAAAGALTFDQAQITPVFQLGGRF